MEEKAYKEEMWCVKEGSSYYNENRWMSRHSEQEELGRNSEQKMSCFKEELRKIGHD